MDRLWAPWRMAYVSGVQENFMSVLGEVRVLSEALERTWERLRGRLGG